MEKDQAADQGGEAYAVDAAQQHLEHFLSVICDGPPLQLLHEAHQPVFKIQKPSGPYSHSERQNHGECGSRLLCRVADEL